MITKGDKVQYRFTDPDDNGDSWESMYEIMGCEDAY
jgi:hypothetical protein